MSTEKTVKKLYNEQTYPRQRSTSWGTRSASLRPLMAAEVVDTAWDVTTINDCNLVMEALVLSSFASSPPLHSRLCRADSFFSCSIFTHSLAWTCKPRKIQQHASAHSFQNCTILAKSKCNLTNHLTSLWLKDTP